MLTLRSSICGCVRHRKAFAFVPIQSGFGQCASSARRVLRGEAEQVRILADNALVVYPRLRLRLHACCAAP
jgi:hypothetical protein